MKTFDVLRTPEEIERATGVYMQLHYFGLESLYNLRASVEAEIERKGGKKSSAAQRLDRAVSGATGYDGRKDFQK
jgi:hypothetical protein